MSRRTIIKVERSDVETADLPSSRSSPLSLSHSLRFSFLPFISLPFLSLLFFTLPFYSLLSSCLLFSSLTLSSLFFSSFFFAPLLFYSFLIVFLLDFLTLLVSFPPLPLSLPSSLLGESTAKILSACWWPREGHGHDSRLCLWLFSS